MLELVPLAEVKTPLRDPVLIVAFGVRRRGGRAAGNAADHVVAAWQGERVARLDSEDVLDFTVRRPQISWTPEVTSLEWPDTSFYVASPQGAEHDFVVVVGFEPHFSWRAFVEAIAQFGDSLGVKTLISLRTLPGNVPHTRPAPILMNSSDLDLELQFGVQVSSSKYEGPADVAAVLAARVQQLKWRTIDLTVLQPHYMPRGANPAATQAIANALDRAFGTSTTTDALREALEKQARDLDEAVSNDPETRSAVAELEQQYDASAERMDFLITGDETMPDLPSGEQLVEEIERMFREDGPRDV